MFQAGYRVAQVRVVFSMSKKVLNLLRLSNITVLEHLAYVEWFSNFSKEPEPNSLMYLVKRVVHQHGGPLVSVIPVSSIRCSVHLIPKFGPVAPREWKSSNILECCSTFFVNPFASRYTYLTII